MVGDTGIWSGLSQQREDSFVRTLGAGLFLQHSWNQGRAGSARNLLVTAQGEQRRNSGEKGLSLKVCESHCAVSSVLELGHCEPQVCK